MSKSTYMAEKIVVVGLGYVGLPLALALARVYDDVIGYDVNEVRIAELQEGVDRTREASQEELSSSTLQYTANPACVKGAAFIIVTVPTPTDKTNRPDLTPLKNACETIGKQLEPGAGTIIIFESTVFPTATEQICGPIIEKASGLRCGRDFKLAYSPERINPGDKEHTLPKICKVVAGQDEDTLDRVANLYDGIIEAGIHKVSSIAVAEAAKVIENTQRDLNIALMNELALICDRLGIPTMEVINAAATKWNFLFFTPGLVGGHCIGVDPYYLTSKAEEVGYHPAVILAGRRINDQMGEYIANKSIRMLAMADLPVRSGRFGILGLTFKENVPDFRNSKVFDIIAALNEYGIRPMVHDPYLNLWDEGLEGEFDAVPLDKMRDMHCLFLAVPHDEYRELGAEEIRKMLIPGGALIDVKSIYDWREFNNGIHYWAL